MATAIVYMAANVHNGYRYIGVTVKSLEHRKRKHLSCVRRGVKSKFYNAVRKYGESSFNWCELILVDSWEQALVAEIKLIDYFKPEYNLTDGGQGALGYKHTPEALERMSELKRGKPGPLLGTKRSPETIERMSQSRLKNPTRYWLGKKRSPETIAKIVTAKTGKKCAPRSKELVAAQTKRIIDAAKAREKAIVCITDGREFKSLTEAALAYGLNKASVSQVCLGKRNSIYGKVFRYRHDINILV